MPVKCAPTRPHYSDRFLLPTGERPAMNSSLLREALVEWMAVACAVTVFIAAALDTPDPAAPSRENPAASAERPV